MVVENCASKRADIGIVRGHAIAFPRAVCAGHRLLNKSSSPTCG